MKYRYFVAWKNEKGFNWQLIDFNRVVATTTDLDELENQINHDGLDHAIMTCLEFLGLSEQPVDPTQTGVVYRYFVHWEDEFNYGYGCQLVELNHPALTEEDFRSMEKQIDGYGNRSILRNVRFIARLEVK